MKSVHYKLSTERTMLDSAQKMRNAHMGNAMARSLVETQIREAQRNVNFFEDTLRDLVERRKRLVERELPKLPGDNEAQAAPPIERDSSKRGGKSQISNFGKCVTCVTS